MCYGGERLASTGEAMRHKRHLGMVSAILAVSLLSSSVVQAIFSASSSISQAAIGTATLQAPTGLTATGGCQVLILGPRVVLNWTATPSLGATGYQIYRSTTNGGPYSSIATVSGRLTTSFTDTSALGLSTTYYYVMRATVANWTSPATSQASGTTPLLCL